MSKLSEAGIERDISQILHWLDVWDRLSGSIAPEDEMRRLIAAYREQQKELNIRQVQIDILSAREEKLTVLLRAARDMCCSRNRDHDAVIQRIQEALL